MAGKRRRVVDTLSLDYETYSDLPFTGPKSVGLHNYATHPTTEAMMVAYRLNNHSLMQVEIGPDRRLPPELREALLDPEVEKWAFNAQFERVITRDVLGLDTPYEGWRCTMVLAYMQSFIGGLEQVGEQIGVSLAVKKGGDGKRLIKMFSQPQKPSKAQPHERLTKHTNPEDWQQFLDYNWQDVLAEEAVKKRLLKYEILEDEWKLYELDQIWNDRGLPVDVEFVRRAAEMAKRRRDELIKVARGLTGLMNPNSGAQLLPWLKERGYWFDDLAKDTIKKVLNENTEAITEGRGSLLNHECVKALQLRQQFSRTSVKKYDALLLKVSDDHLVRHCFQFVGASRSQRWSGRNFQPHNLSRTPKMLEAEGDDDSKLRAITAAIRDDDYDLLCMLIDEPMDALAGLVRSSIQAPSDDEQLLVCDLSAIESAVQAWLTKCVRLLKVFSDGLDPYRDFAVLLYRKLYAEVTPEERTKSKPPVLGAGYGLGGGELQHGKRTGLWGYAEGMGIKLTKDESHKAVQIFRVDAYPEIPEFWKLIEYTIFKALGAGRGRVVSLGDFLKFQYVAPYLTIILPHGGRMYYFQPRVEEREYIGKDGTPYTRNTFSYMGKSQITTKWERIYSGGPKVFENIVQRIARDVLKAGLMRAHEEGFDIRGHVHDEIINLIARGSNYFTLERLSGLMTEALWWAPGLPLKAAGYVANIYRK